LLLEALSVTELLLRRSLATACLAAFFDRDEACLLHAASTATVTLCWTRVLACDGARSERAASDRRCDGRAEEKDVAGDKPSEDAFDVIGRVCAPYRQSVCEYWPMLNRGSMPICGGPSTPERRRNAPAVQPTFLLIIFTGASWSTIRRPRGCETGGGQRWARKQVPSSRHYASTRGKYGECASPQPGHRLLASPNFATPKSCYR
jgi:hypothetical protein